MLFYPADLEIVSNSDELNFWKILESVLTKAEGECRYKFPCIGKDQKNIPTFVICTRKHGIVLIEVISPHIKSLDNTNLWTTDNNNLINSREQIVYDYYCDLENILKQNNFYDRKNNQNIINISNILVFTKNNSPEVKGFRNILKNNCSCNAYFISKEEINIQSLSDLFKSLETPETINNNDFKNLSLLIEGSKLLTCERPKAITAETTVKDIINMSSKSAIRFDSIQKKVAYQIPDGPQRIRGLVGSGKTIVLCMKAALTLLKQQDFKILFLYNTRSLEDEIINLISYFYEREARKGVNWNNIEVLHTWGSDKNEGLYTKICTQYNKKPIALGSVRFKKDPLDYVFKDFLHVYKERIRAQYDLVLIDEAQDFPSSVLEVVYFMTRSPKRIVWAFDEFQSLQEMDIKPPELLFGRKFDKSPNMLNTEIEGYYAGNINKDYNLTNSYRNPTINLMLAQGLTLGTYRNKGLIYAKETKKDWESLGYKLISPDKDILEENDNVKLELSIKTPGNTIENIFNASGKAVADNLIKFNCHENKEKELQKTSFFLNKLINQDNIEPSEIFVITLDTANAETDINTLARLLEQFKIDYVSPGYKESKSNKIKEEGCVTITTAFRAQGNESSIVIIVNTQEVISDITFKMRNALYVAITRSKGWCYLSGHGPLAKELEEEFNKIKNNYPQLHLTMPDKMTLKRNKEILSQDFVTVQEAVNELNNLYTNFKPLLIEKIKNDPEIIDIIKNKP